MFKGLIPVPVNACSVSIDAGDFSLRAPKKRGSFAGPKVRLPRNSSSFTTSNRDDWDVGMDGS